MSTNTALLRQQGKNDQLTLQRFEVGTRLKKDLIIAYMNDIADPKVVEEVRKRVRGIEIDHLPESGYVEQLIEDNYLSPFPQVQSTERPDRVISGLMEGRVAILLDGTPFALIVPVTFSMMLQSPEDYYERWFPSSLIRLLRFIAKNDNVIRTRFIYIIYFFSSGVNSDQAGDFNFRDAPRCSVPIPY